MAKGVSGGAGLVGHRFPDHLPLHPPQTRHALSALLSRLLPERRWGSIWVTLPNFDKLPCCNVLQKRNGTAPSWSW